MLRAAFFWAALVVSVGAVAAADKLEGTAGIERKLLGTWYGPPCGGDLTFAADGSFDWVHFTPGNNHITGTWQLRWDALPPTLEIVCKTTDAPDHLPVGKRWEMKLLELDDEKFVIRYADREQGRRYERKRE